MRFLGFVFAASMMAQPALALDPSWPDLKYTLYGDQALIAADEAIEIIAPYRTKDDARTQRGDASSGREPGAGFCRVQIRQTDPGILL